MTNVFMALQPIFNESLRVIGYEILFRSGPHAISEGFEPGDDSLGVIGNTLLVSGIEKLAGGKKAFINFGKNLLGSEISFKLPAKYTAIKISGDICLNETELEQCRKLHDKGYTVIFDESIFQRLTLNELSDFVDIVKVNLGNENDDDRKNLIATLRKKRIKCLAEKLETRDEYSRALKLGCAYFEGYFFCEPQLLLSRDVPHFKINYIHLIEQINKPDFRLEDLEKTIMNDTALCYKLLRYINSAYFGLKTEIKSIKQALVLLGPKEIKNWVTLLSFMMVGSGNPPEILRASVIRANMCSSIAPKVNMAKQERELFIIGLFSLIDVLVGRPMEEILQEIPLSKTIKSALLGKPTKQKNILDLVISYERAAWHDFSRHASKLKISKVDLSNMYFHCVNSVNTLVTSSPL
jgi:c-di-GMP-related signal transduction protein